MLLKSKRMVAFMLAGVIVATSASAGAEETVFGQFLESLGLKKKVTVRIAPVTRDVAVETEERTLAVPTPAAPNPAASVKATHEQSRLIKVDQQGATQLLTFCLDPQGNILAGCNTENEGQIRVFSPAGEALRTIDLPVVPEALNVDGQGRILVAGAGQLFRLDAAGKVLHQAASAHVSDLQSKRAQIRETILQQNKSRATSYEAALKTYDEQIKRIEQSEKDNGKLTSVEAARLRAYKTSRDRMQQYIDQIGKDQKEPSEEQIEAQVTASLAYKMKVASISAAGDEVFFASSSAEGYGFDVWRTDEKFAGAERIVTGLRGCCGNMDVQACADGIFVAENSRHRVVRFDRAGKEVLNWGSRDRTGVEGFSSCCNPMNVNFGPEGAVYTAESSTGHIKKFSTDGKFLAHVAVVKLVPGCKKVSIAVTKDGRQVYMMDMTRTHIVQMSQRGESVDKAETTEAAGGE